MTAGARRTSPDKPGGKRVGSPNSSRLKRLRRFWWALLACLPLLVISCRSTYYGQAISGQWQILTDRQPIKRILADTNTPAKLRQQLQLVNELRAFAETNLLLPGEGQFISYVDVGRKHVVWNVFAAPEFSLEAKTWWYPLVGSLKYRSYFREADARRCADRLQRKGYDTYVGGVDAYSTLGWFKDPVLSTFVNYSELELAGLIFHELAHLKLFAASDTDFSEAFAVVVEEESVRRWCQVAGRTNLLVKHERAIRADEEFQRLLAGARRELRTLYAGDVALEASQGKASAEALEQLRRDKQAIIENLRREYQRLRAQWGELNRYDRWFTNQIDNARLASEDTYFRLVPPLRQLLAQSQGHLPGFYDAAGRLAKRPKEAREELSNSTAPD